MESTALIVIDTQNALQIFAKGGMNAILDEIEAKVRAVKPDISTAAGREELRSLAYKIARTKTGLDAEGKRLTEDWRAATNKVNEERRKANERLDKLQEEVRQPLTDFENKEKNRVQGHELALKDMENFRSIVESFPNAPVDTLLTDQLTFAGMNADRNWEEFADRADALRKSITDYLYNRVLTRRQWDADQAELERLRKAEADRVQKERDAAIAKEAAAKAQRVAEEKAAAEAELQASRVEAERRRVAEEHAAAQRKAAEEAKAERDRIEREREEERRKAEEAQRRAEELRLAEERDKQTALRRAEAAEAARIASEAKAAEDLLAAQQKAERDQAAAVEAERKRAADAEAERLRREQMKREADDQARLELERDTKHRATVAGEIIDDLRDVLKTKSKSFEHDLAMKIADAIMTGKIRHVEVIF